MPLPRMANWPTKNACTYSFKRVPFQEHYVPGHIQPACSVKWQMQSDLRIEKSRSPNIRYHHMAPKMNRSNAKNHSVHFMLGKRDFPPPELGTFWVSRLEIPTRNVATARLIWDRPILENTKQCVCVCVFCWSNPKFVLQPGISNSELTFTGTHTHKPLKTMVSPPKKMCSICFPWIVTIMTYVLDSNCIY